jgi:hypothetical protein
MRPRNRQRPLQQHQPRLNKKRKFAIYLGVMVTTIALVIGVKVAVAGGDFSRYPDRPPTADQQELEQRQAMTPEQLGATCHGDKATDLSLVASAETEHSTYQVWRMQIDGKTIERTTSLFGTVCGLVNDSRYRESSYEDVPQEVAAELAVSSLRYNIEQVGGLEAYNTSLLNALEESSQSADISRFSSLDVDAWGVVGIEVPADMYEVIEYVAPVPYAD